MTVSFRSLIAAAALVALPAAARSADSPRRVAIEYQELTGTQDMSSSPWVAHVKGAHLWEMGKPASLLIQELAENGNPEFILGTAIGDGGHTFGDAQVGLPDLPGSHRRVVLSVDATHPMVSGAWMLGHTNDGFTGVDAVDAYALTAPMTVEIYALDAGTEKDTETKADLAALGGLGRIPENGVIARHTGVRGDADLPASFKFDASKPVGKVTISPLRQGENS